MSIVLNELVAEHLYHIIIEGRTKPTEIEAILQDSQPMIDRSDFPLIHFIINISACRHYPHLGEIYRVLNPFMAQQKLGWFVVYGMEEKMISFMFGVIANIFKLRVRYVADYAEALNFIQSVDLTLGRWSAELVPEPQLKVQELELA